MLRRAFSTGIALVAAAVVLAAPAQADPPAPALATGLDAGWPDVRGWQASGRFAHQWAPWGEWDLAFSPYPTYQEGVRVAVGDVNGDGRNEIVTAPGKSAFTELRVFDGRTFRQVGALSKRLVRIRTSGGESVYWRSAPQPVRQAFATITKRLRPFHAPRRWPPR
jgi:hypothetical protein